MHAVTEDVSLSLKTDSHSLKTISSTYSKTNIRQDLPSCVFERITLCTVLILIANYSLAHLYNPEVTNIVPHMTNTRSRALPFDPVLA